MDQKIEKLFNKFEEAMDATQEYGYIDDATLAKKINVSDNTAKFLNHMLDVVDNLPSEFGPRRNFPQWKKNSMRMIADTLKQPEWRNVFVTVENKKLTTEQKLRKAIRKIVKEELSEENRKSIKFQFKTKADAESAINSLAKKLTYRQGGQIKTLTQFDSTLNTDNSIEVYYDTDRQRAKIISIVGILPVPYSIKESKQ